MASSRAAAALSEATLTDRFAIALPSSGPPLALPIPEPLAHAATASAKQGAPTG